MAILKGLAQGLMCAVSVRKAWILMSYHNRQNFRNVKKVYVLLMLYVHCESAEGCGESLLLIVTQGPRIMET